MKSMKARLLFGMACAILLAAGPAAGLGGNPLIQARLFGACPEAEIAHAASIDARIRGLLTAPRYAKGRGKSHRERTLDQARDTGRVPCRPLARVPVARTGHA